LEPAIETLIGTEFERAGLKPLAASGNPNAEVGVFRLGKKTLVLVVNHLRHPLNTVAKVQIPNMASARDVFTGEVVECKGGTQTTEFSVALSGMGGRAFWLER
jgi:hypothetical protein